MILETDRLYLRELKHNDWSSLCRILKDAEVMYAYEHAFSDSEVSDWLNRQISRYNQFRFGLWGVILKETNEMIGQCGLTMQSYNEQQVLEVGYLFEKAYWHKGYACEAAIACKKYAFDVLNEEKVYSIIRDTNKASISVARRNGMTKVDEFVKHYYNIDMPHFVYVTINPDYRVN